MSILRPRVQRFIIAQNAGAECRLTADHHQHAIFPPHRDHGPALMYLFSPHQGMIFHTPTIDPGVSLNESLPSFDIVVGTFPGGQWTQYPF
jgi:hypothetical protein